MTMINHMLMQSPWSDGVFYPDSDGEPVDNEDQLDIMLMLFAAIRHRLGSEQLHVGANLGWYPVKGDPRVVQAPDGFVAFGRPQEPKRSGWRQWDEDGVPMDLVVEIISPSNTHSEMTAKRAWYERYGTREYIELDQRARTVEVWRRVGEVLVSQPNESRSELIGLSFRFDGDNVIATWDDGTIAATYDELATQLQTEPKRADMLAARLRALGIDPT
jgi:Uma2 family endonuclease